MSIIFKEFVYDNNNCPVEAGDGSILCSVINSVGEEDTVPLARNILTECNIIPSAIVEVEEKKDTNEWSIEMTRMVLDMYDEYIGDVGPMKKFRNKKVMWTFMAERLNKKFNMNRTAQQVENRFKTVLKRKKNAAACNKRTGSERTEVEFEEELNKIASKDDSIQPEVMKDQNNMIYTPKESIPKNVKRNNLSLVDAFKKAQEVKAKQREQHHKEREEKKDKRHREKMELLRELFNN